MKNRPSLLSFVLVTLAVALLGCGTGGGASLSKDEERNFKQGMSAEKVKEIGPAPKMQTGPGTSNYSHKSAADKAQGF